MRSVLQFMEDHPAILTAPASALVPQLTTTIEQMEELGGSQVFGRGTLRASTQERREIANELRTVLREIAETAKALDPGIDQSLTQQFRMPRHNNYQALVDSGRAFVEAVTPIQAAFVAEGYEADFIENCTELVTRFEAATQRKFGGLQEQVGGSIGLDEAAKRGMALVRRIDAVVSRKLRKQDVALYREWKEATKLRGVQHAPDEQQPQSQPPAPTSAPAPSN